MESKSNKGGRPLKYEGEKPVRTVTSIRPRYKEMLQAIANIRGCTVSEAVELVTAKYCREFRPDEHNRTLYEVIAPKDSIGDLFFDAKRSSEGKDALLNIMKEFFDLKGAPETTGEFEKRFLKPLQDYSIFPSYMKNPLSEYLYKIKSNNIYYITPTFKTAEFDCAVTEAWRRGYSQEEVIGIMARFIDKDEIYDRLDHLIYEFEFTPLPHMD